MPGSDDMLGPFSLSQQVTPPKFSCSNSDPLRPPPNYKLDIPHRFTHGERGADQPICVTGETDGSIPHCNLKPACWLIFQIL